MDKVYILQTSSARDGLYFDYFCKDLDSLKDLAKVEFLERFSVYDVLPEILEVKLTPLENIIICYVDEGIERMWNNYSYIAIPVY